MMEKTDNLIKIYRGRDELIELTVEEYNFLIFQAEFTSEYVLKDLEETEKNIPGIMKLLYLTTDYLWTDDMRRDEETKKNRRIAKELHYKLENLSKEDFSFIRKQFVKHQDAIFTFRIS